MPRSPPSFGRGPVLEVGTHRLVFGAGRLDRAGQADAEAAVAAALEGGVRHLDVAPAYGDGACETRLGHALRGVHRARYSLTTKVGRLAGAGGGPVFDYGAEAVRRCLHDSLARLGVDHVDGLILHDLSARWHGDVLEARIAEALDGAWPAMEALRAEGVVRVLGLGVNDIAVSERFLRQVPLDFLMLAGRTTLLDRSAITSGVIALAEARGVPVIAAAPFNSGILAKGSAHPAATFFSQPIPDPIRRAARDIEAVCADWQVPLTAAALQFGLRHPGVHAIAAGFETATQVEAAFAALAVEIPDAFWQALPADAGRAEARAGLKAKA